ncbi:hypothetical protein FB45DRAFT_920369 [Roridomyces roridus]|uniref:DUF6534 domain-containing protein n=1 Tax=Roridomyces roridus TaxID=1738132 RepID=A0AAD7BPJ0_9AGAR|nr:hypothetical protein FB45DRAFT_920369 [Roridomyces roridus]
MASSLPDPLLTSAVVQISGPLIIGNILDSVLLGILSVQVYLYYQAFPDDRAFTKILVYSVYTIELVTTILLVDNAFAIFGYGFAQLSTLTKTYFAWLTVPTMSGIVACITQCFYAYRIHVLSGGNRVIPGLIVAISMASSTGAFVAAAFIRTANDLTSLQTRRISLAIAVWCSTSALCDVLIAICMTYYLTRFKNITGIRQTQTIVAKLTRLIIETGTLTALVAILILVLFLTFRQRMYYVPPADILQKLYANTILVVLNSRMRIVGGRGLAMENGTEIVLMSAIQFTPDARACANTEGASQAAVDDVSGLTQNVVEIKAETSLE